MKNQFLTGSLLLLLASCAPEKSKQQAADYSLSGDTILVPASSGLTAKLKLDTAAAGTFRLQSVCAGTVKAIPNFYAEIAPPFSGRVTRVLLKLGMEVKPGTPLFEMVSSDFIEAQKNYFAARAELRKAELNLKRQRDLKAHEIGSAKDLEEAQSNFDVVQKEYENNRASLKIYQVNPDKLVLGQPLVVCSPISGTVIRNELVSGHFLKSDEAPHAIIAALNKVWVVGQVKEKDIRFIHKNDLVTVEIAAYPGKQIQGKVYHVEEMVDEETRSVKVLMEFDNPNYLMKPGMYVTVNFSDTPKQTVFVSPESVFQQDSNSFVFVAAGKGKYQRRKVATGVADHGRMVVTSGLHSGEQIVAEGGFYLLGAK